MGKSSKKQQKRVERSETSVDSTNGGDRRPRWRDSRDEETRRPRLPARPGPDPRFDNKKKHDPPKDAEQHKHRKYLLKAGGAKILSCLDLGESERFKNEWTRCGPESSSLDELFKVIRSSMERCIDRECQDIDRWWTSVGMQLEDRD